MVRRTARYVNLGRWDRAKRHIEYRKDRNRVLVAPCRLFLVSKRPLLSYDRRFAEAQEVHDRGDAKNALVRYESLVVEKPDDPRLLHAMGVALAQTGRFDQGEATLRAAIRKRPEARDYAFDLAALYDAQGRLDEAEKTLAELVTMFPDHAEAWAGIGMYRRDRNEYASAGEAYRQAYLAYPDRSEYAVIAAELLSPEDGALLLAERLERDPDDELLLPLAELLIRAERPEEAENVLRSYLDRHPHSARALRHLGGIFAETRRLPEAAASFYAALQHERGDAETWVMLAQVRESLGDLDGASAALDRAVDLDPENDHRIGRRARLQQEAARTERARGALTELPSRLRRTADVRLLAGMLVPPILDSNEHIDSLRGRWMETMEDVAARPTPIAEPWSTVGLTGAYLGYQGREDRALMEAFARATLACSPHLEYTAKNLEGSGERRLRIGFLSAHMRVHSVGRMLVRLMGALDRERFEVVLFTLPGRGDGGQAWGDAHAERTVRLQTDLDSARNSVEAERLDVLLYCDLHLNPFTDALAFSRLAPVQATTWGHPGTGGKDSIDDWLSCEDWEPGGNDRLYTERLVRLPRPPYVYAKPTPPTEFRPRSSFGLKDDGRLYGCLQSLFKIHPDMDAIFTAILDRDPKGRIVLISGPTPAYERHLRRRFERSFDPERVDFIPRVGDKDYPSAVVACDVLLDPIHFGGANTTLDAFALGKPVVTLLGDQMRNRATGGFYRRIGYETLVAKTLAEYAELAVRLTHERRLTREAREAILAGGNLLFDNLDPVSGFEEWLLSVRCRP